jgi:hypothetical protein
MKNFDLNDDCLISALLSILIVIILLWILFPSIKNYTSENFSANNLGKPTGSFMSGKDFDRPVISDDVPPIDIIPSESYLLDDGSNGNSGLHTNLCSPSCCSSQYPLPFKLKYDRAVCQNKDKFVPNNYMCNNSWQDSGCLCLTKKQSTFLHNRGGNA